ncbi:MAG: lipopolysaccharide kinase InaA family protein [Phycisphaerae bacterium]
MRDDWRERMLDDGAPDWFALERAPDAVNVKRGHGRACWRVRLRDGSVCYAKVWAPPRRLDRLRRVIAGAPAEREWRLLVSARCRGVPVILPVAVGACAATGRSVLVTRGFAPPTRLTQLWQDAIDAGCERRRDAMAVIDAVARLLAVGHLRGFAHQDGHPGNMLARFNGAGGVEAVFVDVHAARLTGHRTARRLMVRALAQLDQYFHRSASRTDRLRFLCAYLSHIAANDLAIVDAAEPPSGANGPPTPDAAAPHATPSKPGRRPSASVVPTHAPSATGGPRDPHDVDADPPRIERRRWVAEVLAARAAQRGRLARRWDRRLRRHGKYFERVRPGDGWTATVALELQRRHVFPEPHVPDRTANAWRDALAILVADAARASPSEVCRRVAGVAAHVQCPRTVAQRVRWTLVGSPARRDFERAHRARHRDVPAPLWLGFAEHRSHGLIDRALLLEADAPDPVTDIPPVGADHPAGRTAGCAGR